MTNEARMWAEVADALGVLFVEVLDVQSAAPAVQLELFD